MKKGIIIIALLSIIAIIFTYNNDFLYKKEIMKIIKIDKINEEYYENTIGLKEKHTTLKITGIITNGKNKKMRKTIEYEETYSSIVTDKFKKGDKVILDKNNDIEDLKRDTYIVALVTIFILLMYLVGRYKGMFSIISVIINSIIFYLGLVLYFKGINLLFVCVLEMILFSVISLFISAGINKKTISAVISITSSIMIMLIILLLVVKTTDYKGINFNEISFLTVPIDDIILPELLIGSIGAIMDVAITISSSISELIEKDKNISIKELNKSAHEIGKDIMSSMSNVLFFTYISAGLPLFILAIRNGFGILNYITSNFSLEITRFLVGSIGIVMTIPITAFISIKIFKRGAKYE